MADFLKVRVTNLPTETTQLDLSLHFSQFSDPTMADILKPGTACVAYSTRDEATTAVKAYNNSDFLGAVIKVASWGLGGSTGGKDGKCAGGKGKGGGKDFGAFWGGGGKDFGGKGGYDGKGFFGQSFKGMWGKGGGWPEPDNSGWDQWGNSSKWGWQSKVEAPTDVIWITVGDDSAFAQQGLPTTAPALYFDKNVETFNASGHILKKIVGDMSAVSIVHDADWEQFPEIGEAVKDAFGEESCVAVAVHPPSGKWAVGVAGGWKSREASAKLALAVAIGVEHPDALFQFQNYNPEFVAMCKGSHKTKRKAVANGYVPKPKVAPMQWITLTKESKITTLGLAAEAPAVVHEGKSAKHLFSEAHNILTTLVPDVLTSVKFEDDPDWTNMPEVGAAMKAKDMEEHCYCVAMCEEHGCWGVGVGSGHKFREPAAKLALSVAIAVGAGKVDEMSAEFPDFKVLVESAGLGSAGGAKKRKVAE